MNTIKIYIFLFIYLYNFKSNNSLYLYRNSIKNMKLNIKAYKHKYVKEIQNFWPIGAKSVNTLSNLLSSSSNISSKIIIYMDTFYKGYAKSLFDDPDIESQWYLTSSDQTTPYLSHELDKLWAVSILGQGVNVGIIDGGIEENHKDLDSNYDKHLSYNFIKNSNNISTTNFATPTMVAGLISAVPNNKICGAGTAPLSRFASLQIFDDVSRMCYDYRISKALTHKNNLIQIYIMSWSVNYETEINTYPGFSTLNSLKIGHKYGRGGLGSIFVTGSGHNKRSGNNCAFSGFLQRPEVLVFASITKYGTATTYSERCCSILSSSLSTDDDPYGERIYSTTSRNRCKNSTMGMYASTSISTGIISLLISYNPQLSVRQIMATIIYSSIQHDPTSIKNAAGFYYSYSFGFGMLNAGRLISFSRSSKIRNLIQEHICSTPVFSGNHIINKSDIKIFYIYTSGCLSSVSCITEIEQVYMIFTLVGERRNSISMYLTSPSGTRFYILPSRIFDDSPYGFHRWRLKIMGYFGEKLLGVWTLEIFSIGFSSKFLKLELIFHGTCKNPMNNLIFHEVVRQHICSDYSNLTKSIQTRICDPIDYIASSNLGRDTCSFTGSEYSKILILNDLV